MGQVENLNRYFNGIDSVSEDELKRRLDALEREIRGSWEKHKRHHAIHHGEDIQDNGFRMVLLWLLREGII